MRTPSEGKVTQVEPVGWGEFANVLKEMNVPSLFVYITKSRNHMQLHTSNVPMIDTPTHAAEADTIAVNNAMSSAITRPEKRVYKMCVRATENDVKP